ncbi:MAG: hypothetical protein ACJ760_15960 [Thermoleophilaceae bacterium]
MGFSDSQHLRKTIAGVCMLLAPLTMLVAAVVSPDLETKAGAQLATAAGHLDRFYISNLLGMISLILFVPAALGLMHMVRERRAAYGAWGGGLTMLGILGSLVGAGVGFVIWQMASDGVQAADVSALHGVMNTAGAVIPVYVVGFVMILGAIVLGAGLYLSRVVDWWMALFFAAGIVCINVAFPAGVLALAIVGAALTLVGLGSMGLMVLRESDADWEHTPEYRGMRPAAGMS